MQYTFNDPVYGQYTTNSLIEFVKFIAQNSRALFVLAMLLVGFAFTALLIIAWCRLFKKAGLPWERIFVPYYGSYWQNRIAGCSKLFWVRQAAVVLCFLSGDFALLIGETEAQLLPMAGLIAWIVSHCIYCVKLSKSFGHGVGFGIGLIVLQPVFVLLLGYGKSEYVGEYK